MWTKAKVDVSYGQLPLIFEPNQGQTDATVRFLSRTKAYTVFLTDHETVMVLQRPRARKRHSFGYLKRFGNRPVGEGVSEDAPAVVRMSLGGGNPKGVKLEPLERLPGISSYFKGRDPTKWRTNIPQFARVRYHDVYPGIDMIYYGNQRSLEYDFVLQPGADSSRIQLAYEGIDRMDIDSDGDLVLKVGTRELRQHRPLAYQVVNGRRQPVFVTYAPEFGGKRIRLAVADYRHDVPLVIDPILRYSTYLGGSGVEEADSIAVDSTGNAYVTGTTSSTDFPATPGAVQPMYRGRTPGPGCGVTTAFLDDCGDVFVTKLDATGTVLLYSTYLGGMDDDAGRDITVDVSGNAYVTGETLSSDFPTTAGAFQSVTPDGIFSDAFVTKLSPTGTMLIYSTFLAGSDFDSGAAIRVDGAGNAYIGGDTFSTDFPVTPGVLQSMNNGFDQGFVVKLSPNGSTQIYSSYIGGSSEDGFEHLALDAAGNVYLTGFASSRDFPVTPGAYQRQYGGDPFDAVAVKLNSNGTVLLAATFFGGSDDDQAFGIELDPMGNVYIAGGTASLDLRVTASSLQPKYGGGDHDAFIAKFDPNLTRAIYATYLGGSGDDVGSDLKVDPFDQVYIAGTTDSPDFLLTKYPLQPHPGEESTFVTKIDVSGTSALFSTYFGGSKTTAAALMALRPLSSHLAEVFLVGVASNSFDFPSTPRAPSRPFAGGDFDAFIAKLAIADLAISTAFKPGSNVTASSVVSSIAERARNLDQPEPQQASGEVPVGSTVSFVSSITNFGPDDAQNIVVSGSLPSTLTLLSCTATGSACNAAGGQVTAQYPTLAVGDSTTVTIMAKVNDNVPDGAVIRQTSTVRSDTDDPDLSNNTSTVVFTTHLVSFVTVPGVPVSGPQSISIGGGDLVGPFTASTSSSWLQVSPTSGTAPSALSIFVQPVGLRRGVYYGSVSVSYANGGSDGATVKLTVFEPETINLSSTHVQFVYERGGPSVPSQSITVDGSPGLTFNTSSPVARWLKVIGGNKIPTTLTVSVDPTGLPNGAYGDLFTVSAPGVDTQTVRVQLVVQDRPTLLLQTNSLSFGFQAGDPLFPSKTVTISAGGRNIDMTATSDSPWLSVAPGAAKTPVVLTIVINPALVASGVYSGAITIASKDATNSPQRVDVKLTVAGPVISAQGVMNDASQVPGPLAPGALFVINGSNLSTQVKTASSNPLPTNLASTTVRFSGVLAPLMSVGPSQIVGQVPFEVAPGTTGVVVSSSGSTSSVVPVRMAAVAPGLFMSGSNRARVRNEDGAMNTPDTPASTSSIISASLTGQGPVDNPLATGAATPESPVSHPMLPVTATLGGRSMDVVFAGLAPGVVGLLQVNLRVPALPPGDYQLVVNIGGVASNPGMVSVMPGSAAVTGSSRQR